MQRAPLTRNGRHIGSLVVLLMSILWTASAWAAGFEVLKASTKLEGGVYRLSAHLEYHFSTAASEALQNGVPLTVEVNMEVLRRRSWLWAETVHALTQRFRLEYHALSRQYLVTNVNSGERRGFPSRVSALDFLGRIDDFPFLDKSLLASGERYEGALRVRLDIEALPAPLRLFAYLSDDWRLASEWYTWPL
ncbi:MAG: DUF4390 domain-containing protein [Candidatus Competibacteraceae bacterium]